jgi:hypothetical protein
LQLGAQLLARAAEQLTEESRDPFFSVVVLLLVIGPRFGPMRSKRGESR